MMKTVVGLAAFCLLSAAVVSAVNIDLNSLTGNHHCDAELLDCVAPFLEYVASSAAEIANYLVDSNCADVLPAKQCGDRAVRSHSCSGVIPASFIDTAMTTADRIIASCSDRAAVTAHVQTLLTVANNVSG